MSSKSKHFWPKVALFFSVIGPGIITALANNDAGGISTYSIVGARYGLQMLWILFVITIALGITQEMGMRIGLVTRQGLSGVIRENFGLRWTVFAMVTMLITNLGTMAAEFSGIAASFEIVGVSKYITIPIAAFIIWMILYKGSFKTTQRIFLAFSTLFIVYIINGFFLKPDFNSALVALVTPTVQLNAPFLLMAIALVGTTITPWGQFFIQSYVVDKGLDEKSYGVEKIEAYLGSFLASVVAFFIIITTSTVLHSNGIDIASAKDAALALKPLLGNFAQLLFGFGLFCASMLGAFLLPVATAYVICEAFGWECGFNTTWKNGKFFYSLILLTIILPALAVLIPGISLINVILYTQNVNGVLLPIILIFVMRIINNKKIMGKHVNKPVGNIIAWVTIIGIIAATLVLVVSSFI